MLERLAKPYAWEQVSVTDATIAEVIAEIEKATDEAVFAGCIMIGEIKELCLDTIPDWLLLCDGTEYANVDYPELAAVIHPGFITDADHFRVPQREGRFALQGASPGSQGGEETVTLTVEQIPPHAHTYDKVTATLADPGVETTIPAIDDINTVDTGETGGGEAHNNMPPYEETQFFIVARYPSA